MHMQAEIVRVEGRETLTLTGHNNYIQGVAWDPLNEHVVTQSADRSVKMYPVSILCVLVYSVYRTHN